MSALQSVKKVNMWGFNETIFRLAKFTSSPLSWTNMIMDLHYNFSWTLFYNILVINISIYIWFVLYFAWLLNKTKSNSLIAKYVHRCVYFKYFFLNFLSILDDFYKCFFIAETSSRVLVLSVWVSNPLISQCLLPGSVHIKQYYLK